MEQADGHCRARLERGCVGPCDAKGGSFACCPLTAITWVERPCRAATEAASREKRDRRLVGERLAVDGYRETQRTDGDGITVFVDETDAVAGR